ncbi:hypothetical protein AXJ17_gp46 [Lactobacillus phage LfeSau]|nr:hypothetical protein AXJ17_gp46 [Lactobacillus phage LfeSau]AIY32295.1 hypothetical protein LfeSau_46 [Lactobacillus phage LfeSau]
MANLMTSRQKAIFTADEINDLVGTGDFGDLGLWEVIETAPGFPG